MLALLQVPGLHHLYYYKINYRKNNTGQCLQGILKRFIHRSSFCNKPKPKEYNTWIDSKQNKLINIYSVMSQYDLDDFMKDIYLSLINAITKPLSV